MINNKTRKMMLILFSMIVVFLFTMCDDFKDETLKPDATDAFAIEVFQDTNTVELPMFLVEMDSAQTKYYVTYNDVKDSVANQYSSVVSAIEDANAIVEIGDKHYTVDIEGKGRDNSIILKLTSAKEVYVYTTECVNVTVRDATKNELDRDSNFPMELVAGLFDYNEDKAGDYPKPIVKSKSAFDLSAGTYVLNINTTEATTSGKFDLVVIEKQ